MEKVAKEQKIQNEEKEVAKSKEKAKKLVLPRFYKQIHIFEKKQVKEC